MTLTINENSKKTQGNQITFALNEEIKLNECCGDQIGICAQDNILWFDYALNLDNEDVQEFIDNYFTKPISIALTIKQQQQRNFK